VPEPRFDWVPTRNDGSPSPGFAHKNGGLNGAGLGDFYTYGTKPEPLFPTPAGPPVGPQAAAQSLPPWGHAKTALKVGPPLFSQEAPSIPTAAAVAAQAQAAAQAQGGVAPSGAQVASQVTEAKHAAVMAGEAQRIANAKAAKAQVDAVRAQQAVAQQSAAIAASSPAAEAMQRAVEAKEQTARARAMRAEGIGNTGDWMELSGLRGVSDWMELSGLGEPSYFGLPRWLCYAGVGIGGYFLGKKMGWWGK